MHKLDARGKVCPLPLFYTKKEIEKLKSGDELEVLTDDDMAKSTIPQWIREHGHDVVKVEGSGNDIRFVVRKH